ncbi:ribosome-associated translation inhibitor RaiA [candidate division KSB1 bacterium]|nr:ribosome-associated translation inhibitor RaiA [candidate division KSB1 bacterium]
MRITFTARHFKTSDRLKNYAEEKVKKLRRYDDTLMDISIILDYVKQEQVAEIISKVSGNKFAVVEKSEDMYKSIDLAVDKLERKLKKHKQKLRRFENERITQNFDEK